MHNYHKMAPGGGLEHLELGTLHKRGAAHERRNKCSTRRGRAEGYSGRDSGRKPDDRPTSTGKNSICLRYKRGKPKFEAMGGCDTSAECRRRSGHLPYMVSFIYSAEHVQCHGIYILLSCPRLSLGVAA